MFKTVGEIIIVIFITCSVAFSAFEIQSFNPEVIGVGGISSIGVVSLNPSYLREGDRFDFSVGYVNLFGLKELQGKELSVSCVRKGKHCLKLHVTSLGNSLYRENLYNVGFGRRCSQECTVGIGVNVYNLYIRGYQSSFRTSLDIGFTFFVTERFSSTILFRNFLESFFRKYESNIPQEFYCGFVYSAEERVEIVSEIYKDIMFPFTFRMGVKINLSDFLNFLAGYQINPDRFSVGIVVKFRCLRFCMSYLNHQYLPATLYYGSGCQVE